MIPSASDHAKIAETVPRGTSPIIVGWRNKDTKPDQFGDFITFFDGTVFRRFEATTRPGLAYLHQPTNPKGTAILKPGVYRDTFILGPFKGNTVLRQQGVVTVYRDNDRDGQFDLGPIEERGIFGIHIHGSSDQTRFVGQWSAGCQVIKGDSSFREFIALCKGISQQRNTSLFTYVLVDV